MNRQAHFEQILERARARRNLAVHDSEAPLDDNGQVVRASYVVLHDIGVEAVGDQRLTRPPSADDARKMRVVGRCVGVDPAAARRVAAALIAQCDQFVPVVDGRECTRLIVEAESKADKDKAVSPPLWYVDVDFTYWSNPAG